jgi:hypothetical protein
MRTKHGRLRSAAAVTSVSLIVAAVAAGCSGSSSSSSPGLADGAPAVPSASAAAGSGSAFSGSSAGSANSSSSGGSAPRAAAKYAATGQQLIYTAQLTVRASNVQTAISNATSIVTDAGGYVSGENASSGNGQPSQATATVTFKIPAAVYATTLAQLSGRGLGTQLSLAQQAQDVTQQVADVNSRVASDQAAIAQLRELLKHAGDVGSLLSVQNQINSEESDLESMLAQQSALNHETSYATLTLTLVGPKAVVKPAAKTAPPGFGHAITSGWHALHLTFSWLLTILGAIAPFAAVLAVIGALAWWGRRRFTSRRRQQPTDPSGTV